MRYSLAVFFALALIASPFSAYADVSENELRVMHVLGQIAAITASRDTASVACALVSTKDTVRAGEPFTLIWNSFGAVDPSESGGVSQWERGGAATIRVDTPGIKQYRFTFYAKTGEKATCTTLVSIVASR